MARRKVKLAWITNDASRRATFKKRKKGLLKKAQELSTLCDVRACVVVYGGPNEQEADAWPSAAESQRILRQFRSMPETEQSKKMVDQEGFLRLRIAKTQEQLRRLERENRELDGCLLMHETISGHRDINAAPIEEAMALAWLVEMRLRNVQDRIHHLRFPDSSRAAQSGDHLQISGQSTPVVSPNQSLTTQGFLPPTVLPSPQIMSPDATANASAANPATVQTENYTGLPSWFGNPEESIGSSSRSNETVHMQPYLDAAAAWNSYLHPHN